MQSFLITLLENNLRGAKTAGLAEHEIQYEKALEQAYNLYSAIDIAKAFIDGVGAARVQGHLGRDAYDIALKQINDLL